MSFDSNHDTDITVRSRPDLGCTDPVTSQNYRTLVSNILNEMRLHYNSVINEFAGPAGVKTLLDAFYTNTFFTAQLATGTNINTELTNIKSVLDPFETSFLKDADSIQN